MKILLVDKNDKLYNHLSSKFTNINFTIFEKKTNLLKYYDGILGLSRIEFIIFFKKYIIKKKINTKWLHLPGAGIEDYSLYLNSLKIKYITNNKNIMTESVADHGLSLLLSITRKINENIKHGLLTKYSNRPIELMGLNALILGKGSIGKAIEKRLKAFRMNTFRFKRSLNFKKIIDKFDVLFVALPLTKDTKYFVNENNLINCKKNLIIINVSREDIVDPKAILKFLNLKKMHSYCLDIYNTNLNKDYKNLIKHKNVIITPHTAGISQGREERLIKLITKNIDKLNKSIDLLNKINIKKGY